MWLGMLYDVECLWPGRTSCPVVLNGGVKLRSVWFGMLWCDFFVWYGYGYVAWSYV